MCVGREDLGLHLCQQMGRVASLRGRCERLGSLALVSAMAGANLGLPGLARSWQQEQPESTGKCTAVLWFPKISFALLCFLQFHCNKLLHCAVVGTDLLLRLMQSWKPGEAPWDRNI